MTSTKNLPLKYILGILLLVLFSLLIFSDLSAKDSKKKLVVPDINKLKDGDFKKSVLRGQDLVKKTPDLLPDHVGGKISCTNCHLQMGTRAKAAPWVGIIARFPQYRKRSASNATIEDRINGCFQRSMNGKPLKNDSQAMKDMVAYMTFLSQGYKKGDHVLGQGIPKLVLNQEPDVENGKKVYMAKCVACHQITGLGISVGESRVSIFPPLWGKDSYNIGAGMARLHTAAGFVKHNMPQGQEGTLTDKEAWDVAYYFSRQDRPDFKNKHKDWPKGGKPKDARY